MQRILLEEVCQTCFTNLDDIKRRLKAAKLDHEDAVIATDIRQCCRRLGRSSGPPAIDILNTIIDMNIAYSAV